MGFGSFGLGWAPRHCMPEEQPGKAAPKLVGGLGLEFPWYPRCRRYRDEGSQGGIERADSSSVSLRGMPGCTQVWAWLKGKAECIIVFRCNITLPGTGVGLSALPTELSLNQEPLFRRTIPAGSN